MKLAFVGNQDNNAYRLCKWVRQGGTEAELYMFRSERGPRSRPELVDPQLGTDGANYPDWIHLYDDTRGHLSLVLGGKLARQIEERVDVIVTSGATGLLAARHFRRRPVVHLSLGSEIAEFPLLLWRWRISPAWRAVSLLCRRAIRRVDRIIEVYSRSILTLQKLGQLDKMTFWGFPEDVQGNRSRVDATLLKELTQRYASHDGVFLWLPRLNMVDPHWADYKAPERFLEAFEKIVRGNRFRVRAIIGRHGRDLEEFQRRLAQKGLSEHVDYVEHLPYYQLLTYMSIPNAVVFDSPDEERGGTLGGIGRESLSVGAILVEGLDMDLMDLVFGPGCPVLNTPNAQAVYDAMHRLLSMTPAQRQELRQEIARWVAENLDWPRRVDKFLTILRDAIYCHDIAARSRRWAQQDPAALAKVKPKP